MTSTSLTLVIEFAAMAHYPGCAAPLLLLVATEGSAKGSSGGVPSNCFGPRHATYFWAMPDLLDGLEPDVD